MARTARIGLVDRSGIAGSLVLEDALLRRRVGVEARIPIEVIRRDVEDLAAAQCKETIDSSW